MDKCAEVVTMETTESLAYHYYQDYMMTVMLLVRRRKAVCVETIKSWYVLQEHFIIQLLVLGSLLVSSPLSDY